MTQFTGSAASRFAFQWAMDDAPISVIYASRRHLPRRTRLFIDALAAHFAEAANTG